MIRALVVRVIMLALTCLLIGCGDPCDDLAGRICKRVGSSDPLCIRLTAIAGSPRTGDGASCDAANAFIDELQRTR